METSTRIDPYRGFVFLLEVGRRHRGRLPGVVRIVR
jgi:hypothetical protein